MGATSSRWPCLTRGSTWPLQLLCECVRYYPTVALSSYPQHHNTSVCLCLVYFPSSASFFCYWLENIQFLFMAFFTIQRSLFLFLIASPNCSYKSYISYILNLKSYKSPVVFPLRTIFLFCFSELHKKLWD